MVDIAPFRGLVYRADLANAPVYAPPYDVVSPEKHRALLDRHEFNAVRLILPETAGRRDWHQDAARTLAAWQEGKVLVRDATARLYAYQQRFRLGDGEECVRTGFLARVRLVPWGEGIYRHERTKVGPRADRLGLVRATRMNMSAVFGLYHDPDLSLHAWLKPPEDVAVDVWQDGVHEIFWPIVETEAIRALVAGLTTRKVVIADGHHRYETALAYRDERRAQEGSENRLHGYDYVMIYLTAVEDPGMLVLPTHRVVVGAGLPDESTLLTGLGSDFRVQKVSGLALALSECTNDDRAIGMYLGRGSEYLLWPQESSLGDSKDLAVSVLQERIMAPYLGISTQDLATGESVQYTTNASEACWQVDEGRARAAFLLRPTPLDRVWDSALRGVAMPQKSTYFYPKLLSGLVLNPLDDGNLV